MAEEYGISPDAFVVKPDEMDLEWERQSSLCFSIGKMYADSRLKVSDLEREADVIRADVYLEIRRSPTDYGLSDKPTVAALDAAVSIDHRVIASQKALADAQHESDVCKAALTAVEHKKKALEALLQLRTIGYYSNR